jgi:hypothetical protein
MPDSPFRISYVADALYFLKRLLMKHQIRSEFSALWQLA